LREQGTDLQTSQRSEEEPRERQHTGDEALAVSADREHEHE